MTTTTNIVRTFDAEFLPLVLEQIAKAAKLATRLGAPQPVHTLSAPYEVKTGRRSQVTGQPIMKVVYDIDLTVEPLCFNGWTLRARIEHDKDIGTLVHCVPGASVPEGYRSAKPTCDHCNAKRARKDTFVLQHDDGRWFCVGRQCVADFLGHNVNLTTGWRVLGTADDEEFWGGLRGEPTYSLTHELLPAVVRIIQAHGFVSRKAAQIAHDRQVACDDTTSSLLRAMLEPSSDSKVTVTVGGRNISESTFSQETWHLPLDNDAVSGVRTFWAAVKPRNEFEDNCQKIMAATEIKLKHFGLFCAAVSSYFRHLGQLAERRVEAAKAAESVHVGTVGKREYFALTCTKVIDVPTDFGTLHINKMIDAAGNVVVWKTTSDRLAQGRTYTGKCTVKKHDNYMGAAQTLVSRCALEIVPQ